MESKEDFLRIYLRERVGEGQREGISSRLPAEHGVLPGAPSHDPEIMS